MAANSTAKQMDGGDWALLLVLSALWGGGYFFAGFALRETPPMTLVAVRVALAAAALLPVFWAFGHHLPRSAAAWAPFFVMGLLNNALPFGFIFAGQTFVTVGLASIVNAMTPVFAVLVMAAFREEKLTLLRGAGVALGAFGVAVLHGFAAPSNGPETIGLALCLCGALAYGFAALWGRRALSGVAPLKSATCQLLCSTLIMAMVAIFVDQPWELPAPSAETAAAIVALALISTAAAYLVFFTILVRAGASNAMLVTLLIPVTALLLGHLILGDEIRSREIIGALIIGAGLLFIDGRVVRWVLRRFIRVAPATRLDG